MQCTLYRSSCAVYAIVRSPPKLEGFSEMYEKKFAVLDFMKFCGAILEILRKDGQTWRSL